MTGSDVGQLRRRGQRALSASADGTARLWSLPDGKLLRKLDKIDGVLTAAWQSAGGERLVTLDQEGVARLYGDTGTQPLAQLSDPGGPMGPLTQISLSQAGDRVLAIVAAEQQRRARLWGMGRTASWSGGSMDTEARFIRRCLVKWQAGRDGIARDRQAMGCSDGALVANLGSHRSGARQCFRPTGNGW